MKHHWNSNDLIDHWSLFNDEMDIISNISGANRLGFAIALKFFQKEAKFPNSLKEISDIVGKYVANQVDVSYKCISEYNWKGETNKKHRLKIRTFWGFRTPTAKDSNELIVWLIENIIPEGHALQQLIAIAFQHLRELKIEPFSSAQIDRYVRSALQKFENNIFNNISSKLSSETKQSIDDLLTSVDKNNIKKKLEVEDIRISHLKNDPGKSNLDSVFTEVTRLECIRQLNLNDDLFKGILPKIIKQYHQRIMGDTPKAIRSYKPQLRYAIMAIFCRWRSQIITDGLVDILIQIIHKFPSKAERKVVNKFIKEIKRVKEKNQLLFKVAKAATDNPKGVVEDVLYPAVGEQTLKNIVEEYKSSGMSFNREVHTVMRSSYSRHYRRMLPPILKALEFSSSNAETNPVLKAVNLLKKYIGSNVVHYSPDEYIPIDGVIRSSWTEMVLENKSETTGGINRINYEMGVLPVLRDRLRCKEIWVKGANRYRNPDEDLPADFDEKRKEYYEALKLPLDGNEFIDTLKKSMRSSLEMLDKGMPANKKVKILNKKKGRKGWISLSPLKALEPPPNLKKIKKEILERWPSTGLLDILKECDMRVDITSIFQSTASREILDRKTLQKRILLSLFGIGTNAGLKRISAGNPEMSYEDLRYIRRRFINKTYVRKAIAKIVDEIFEIRDTFIWGESTTAIASDSKQFGAWNQNLMSEYHNRYRSPGIMIYWHVEKGCACIYSQLKTCSSSEVASMIKGVLKHCTTMDVEKNYVDTHGQSKVGFAFSHLLGFDLLPRLKGIHTRKLYRPDTGKSEAYSNLQYILTRPINWKLIFEQYDQMVKYTTALRLGTAEPEDILRRFTKNNVNHPTYQVLIELGNVVETIFLCRYLHSEELRQEIQGGLNMVELWNSVNGFIFFGKGGEFSSNNLEDQELTMLCLHLLQISMVYINTLMIQEVLSEPKWSDLITEEDSRALNPLIHGHINPYGTFELNMDERLVIG